MGGSVSLIDGHIDYDVNEVSNKLKNSDKLTRGECESAITAKLLEIWDIYRRYNPEGKYLFMNLTPNYLMVNNQYWEDEEPDKYLPIRVNICLDLQVFKLFKMFEAHEHKHRGKNFKILTLFPDDVKVGDMIAAKPAGSDSTLTLYKVDKPVKSNDDFSCTICGFSFSKVECIHVLRPIEGDN